MNAMGTHEIVSLIKSSDQWETMLQVAKEIRGLSNLEAMELAKQKGLYRTRSADAGIVLEPWIVKDPKGVVVFVSFEVCRQQVNVSVESPKGKLDAVTAVIGDEIKEHFERTEGKPQPCPWSRSELRGFIAEMRQRYREMVLDGQEPQVEKTETKAGRQLSLVARRYRRTAGMQLVLRVYASDSESPAERVFDPSVSDVPDGQTLQTWINGWLARSSMKS
jgi:hypothetical protein